MSEEFGNDIVSVEDENGVQHQLEVLDAIETDEGRYVALAAYYEDPAEAVADDGELIVLKVVTEDGEDLLVPIEDDDEFDEIAEIFEERLAEMYDFDNEEE